ncbi:hypothetical protein [Streptomyces sp. NPDC021224]|uniref:hypothetical protein n=1 Tax=unclassified Streptomyces TaxID=2593676 RepID=UPI003787C90C
MRAIPQPPPAPKPKPRPSPRPPEPAPTTPAPEPAPPAVHWPDRPPVPASAPVQHRRKLTTVLLVTTVPGLLAAAVLKPGSGAYRRNNR